MELTNPSEAEFWFYDGVVKIAQKKGQRRSSFSWKGIGNLMRNENPQLDQVALRRRWAALYINLWREEKAFEQFELALKLNPKWEQGPDNYAYFSFLWKKLDWKGKKNGWKS